MQRDLLDGLPTFEPGWVWLVGAGPGAPGLMSLLSYHALQHCDIVVYDALVNPGILRWARAGAGSGQRVAAAGADMFPIPRADAGLLSPPTAGAAPCTNAGRASCSTGACENSARASETVRDVAGLLREGAVAVSSVAAADGSAALPATFSASSFRNQQWRPVLRSTR